MSHKTIWLVAIFIHAFLLAVINGAVVHAQQPKKIPRPGYLTYDPASAEVPRREAFRQGLRELGYNEGQNIVVEYRSAEGIVERLPELAADLARLKVDVVFAMTAPAVRAVNKEMPAVPIVSVAPDPVAAGLVASLAQPGGNITGFSTTAGMEIYGKYVELLMETVATMKRVAVLVNPTAPSKPPALREIERVIPAFKVSLRVLEAQLPSELDPAFAVATKERAGGLIVVQDSMFLGRRTQLADLAAKNKLPAIYGILEHADAGGLMAYAASRLVIFRRAAVYVDKILKGAKPGDLPVEQPKKFEFVINLKAAKQIGLTIPPNVLSRADRVIR